MVQLLLISLLPLRSLILIKILVKNAKRLTGTTLLFGEDLLRWLKKYVRKGTKVYIEGRLKKRSWQDKEGNTRYTTEVLCDNLTILSEAKNRPIQNNNANYSSDNTPGQPDKINDLLDDKANDLPF